MNRALALFLLTWPAAAFAAEPAPRAHMKDGARAFDEGRFEEALGAFEDASRAAGDDRRLDAATPSYNAANTLMRMQRFDEAAQRYQDALRSADISLQSRAFFNRGNALYHLAEQSRAEGQLDLAPQAIAEALRMYEQALLLNAADADGKINYELALLKQKEIEEQKQQQQEQQQQQQEQQKNDQPQPEDEDEKEDEKEDGEQRPEQQQQEEQQQEEEQQQQEQQGVEEPQPAEQMTPEEAKSLLDRMKQEEQAYRDQLRLIMGQPVSVEKDW